MVVGVVEEEDVIKEGETREESNNKEDDDGGGGEDTISVEHLPRDREVIIQYRNENDKQLMEGLFGEGEGIEKAVKTLLFEEGEQEEGEEKEEDKE